jgi:hypothetical protein
MDWATMVFPGEFCRTSGVYKVVHYQHRLPHHVTVRETESFPVCRKCHSKVRYFHADRLTSSNLQTAAAPIVEDPDLSGIVATV